MRAITLHRYGSPAGLAVSDVARPEPGPDDVLVRVRVASVNDWDWNLVRGTPAYMRLLCGLRAPRIRVPGVDLAGTVESTGANVTTWQRGDRVIADSSASGFGAFAEYACVPAAVLARLPDAVPFDVGAALPHAAALAHQGLHRATELAPVDRLLINGAGGGVGPIATQLARHFGVREITGVDRARKHDAMRRAGCDHVIDFQTTDVTRTGARYDAILDMRSTRTPWSLRRALTRRGRYVTVGGTVPALLSIAGRSVLNRITARRYHVLALRPNEALTQLAAWCADGVITPVLDSQRFPLEQTGAALQRFGDGVHVGKVLIDVDR